MDDVSEVEELEGLEEGRHHAIDLEDKLSPVASPRHQLMVDDSIIHTYKQGAVSVLPYCGCEPLECHLLPEPTPVEDMRIDHVRPLYYIAMCDVLLYRVALVRISLNNGIRNLYWYTLIK